MNSTAKVRVLINMGLAAVIAGAPVSLEAQQAGDVLITGGTVIEQGEAPQLLDILFSRQDVGLVVEAVGDRGLFQAADTIDLSGLYLHTANTLSARQPFGVGGHAMYVVRTGPSQGDAARMVILPSRIQLVESTSNYPEGPMHEAVGCYFVEHGPWDRPLGQQAQERLSVPEAIQLHWQFLWHLGREDGLAATEGNGQVPANANIFAWRPAGGDSIRIDLSDGHVGVTFLLLPDESGYAGTVSRWVHSGDASTSSQAATRLMPASCAPS